MMQEISNNCLSKFLHVKLKHQGLDQGEKSHKNRRNDSPHQIDENTRFILGSVANRVLGYSEARGRIYTRHSNLFVYKCEKDDKKALFKTGRVSRIIGRIHLVVAEDIENLIKKHPDYISVFFNQGSPEYLSAWISDKTQKASYSVSEIIAKNIKSHTRAEREMVSITFGEVAALDIQGFCPNECLSSTIWRGCCF
ncbi:Deoxynucleotidyltransferase terminal-interacting protein 1 [Thelohanellus kitauei]|uniref:Deoxynucleotidyltransferase terminal-interacting protein 1 n=1 Tax=Thelohanellus kitauei TaxID=669202 RepID=A0A0C2N853_THEKT|nr:Deoxynucleotidyltransferase terminal-interacting protein 1 [Thelohanellus kitauei]